MKLIINADDLGISEKVNAEIFELISRGIVTSSTIIANSPLVEETLLSAKSFSNASIGVHLNLTQFAPLSDIDALKPILDGSGNFINSAIRRVKITASLREGVFREWCAQIDRVVALGLSPSHLDSHHHTHTIAALFPALKRLQRKYGIRKVRITKNIYRADATPNISLAALKNLWIQALRYHYATRTTDGFLGFAEFLNLVGTGELDRRFGPLISPRAVIELGVHPGNDAFAAETSLLLSNWREGRHFQLMSYNQL